MSGSLGKCRVVLADDHLLVRHGLKRILAERPDIDVVGEASDGLELLKLLHRVEPDVVLLDISMPNVRGIEAIPEIKRIRPEAKIVVLTMHKDQEYVTQSLDAGADGYLLKEDAEKDLFDALEKVSQGKLFVSPFLAQQLSASWVQIYRGEKQPPASQPLSPPGDGDPEADSGWEIKQRDRRHSLHQRSHRGAPPLEHHGQAACA